MTTFGSKPNAPEWRSYPRDTRYVVSSDGAVMRNGRVLKPRPTRGGYLRISLSRNRDEYIHTMVLETFIGPRPAGHQASHLNGDKGDNFILNLTWETPAKNNSWKKLHGTEAIGVRNAMGRKTHCKRGHEFNDENTRRHNGRRTCRACARLRKQNKRVEP